MESQRQPYVLFLNFRMCHVYGEEDIRRQKLNVFQNGIAGAKVVSVTQGSATLKDAVNEALRYWVANVEDTHYIIGSVLGPHPFPKMVRDFQSVIGKETKKQFFEKEKVFPKLSWLVLEVEVTRWGCSILLLKTKMLSYMALRQRGRELKQINMQLL